LRGILHVRFASDFSGSDPIFAGPERDDLTEADTSTISVRRALPEGLRG
jgi:hypothetical protein